MILEKHFFHGNPGKRIFCRIYQANVSSNNRKPGIVFCDPFAEEKLWSQRLLVNFARFLAQSSYAVLRFDYRGHGDSDGHFEESSIKSWLDDISMAVNILKEKGHIDRVVLFGVRLGATMAVLRAEQEQDIDSLILWEPIINIENYIKQCLRSSLTTQMATYKRIVYTREEMIENLEKGLPVNIDGYLMSADFYRQALTIDLDAITYRFSNPVFIGHISKAEKIKAPKNIQMLYEKYHANNPDSFLAIFQEDPFWADTKKYIITSEMLFTKTLTWLEKTAE